MSYLVPFCSCVFSPFSIAITLLGEERANISPFRTFDRFVLVWICGFLLPLGVWEGLRFVIMVLPGLFSYLVWQFARFRLFLQNGCATLRQSLRLYIRRAHWLAIAIYDSQQQNGLWRHDRWAAVRATALRSNCWWHSSPRTPDSPTAGETAATQGKGPCKARHGTGCKSTVKGSLLWQWEAKPKSMDYLSMERHAPPIKSTPSRSPKSRGCTPAMKEALRRWWRGHWGQLCFGSTLTLIICWLRTDGWTDGRTGWF